MSDSITLELKNIKKRFGANQVLNGVSLQASKGSVISILGASGSGKSTLLRCANLLEVPDEGDIICHGEKIELTKKHGQTVPKHPKQIRKIRSKLAMVFQQFNLWSHMTVFENVLEAPIRVLKLKKSEAISRANNYLEKVGIYDKKDSYPAHLSGGQQQRAGIARALAMEPDLMLFDEPTSALDPELVNEVLQVMQKLASEGRTMLVVTHELAFAKEVSSLVIYLHQGMVEEQNEPNQFFNNPSSPRLETFLSAVKK